MMPIETLQIVLGGKSLQLDLQNRHEKDYLEHFTTTHLVQSLRLPVGIALARTNRVITMSFQK